MNAPISPKAPEASAVNYTHAFATDKGGFVCGQTGKVAERCWTNHARAQKHAAGRLTPNSCVHCAAPGTKFPSLQELNDKRAKVQP